FSSRRRHTRSDRDWSSDVCSSDLACAVVPHVVNQRAAALSLGCCGARAYLDVLSDDVAIFALPGARLDAYVARIAELAKANSVLASFHALRRKDVEAGASPTVKQSLERLSAR